MVPRVTLLDAQVLDEHISRIFFDQAVRTTKFLPTWIVNNLNVEMKTFLQCLLTYYSVSKSKASFGQQLLGVKYKSDQLTDIKLILLNVLTIGGSYVASKVENPSKNFINKFNDLETIFIVLKVASFLNFLIFLRQGTYPTLTQRILNLSQESTRKRTVGYEFMTREMLWHGFSELLLFTLPLVNYQSVKHKVKRLIYSYSTNKSDKWIDKSAAALQAYLSKLSSFKSLLLPMSFIICEMYSIFSLPLPVLPFTFFKDLYLRMVDC